MQRKERWRLLIPLRQSIREWFGWCDVDNRYRIQE